MNFKHFAAACFVFSALCSCGNNETVLQTKDGKVEIENVRESGEKMKAKLDEYQKKREERVKRGDTLAMSYQELEQYLPALDGYEKKGTPKGERISMPGIGSWSKTRQQYSHAGKLITVEINDYNQSANGFAMAAAVFAMNIQIENDREKSGSFDPGIANVRGYEKLLKKSGRITQTYVLSDRFLVRIDGKDGVDSETLKQIAQRMPLAELAAK
jgi:hypothetical protein